jgi:hypothetical protein
VVGTRDGDSPARRLPPAPSKPDRLETAVVRFIGGFGRLVGHLVDRLASTPPPSAFVRETSADAHHSELQCRVRIAAHERTASQKIGTSREN